LVGLLKQDCFNQQNRNSKAATPAGCIGSVTKLSVVDVVGAVAADVLLREKISCAQQLAVVRVRRRKELAHQRQRALVAAARLCAAGGVTPDYQRSTVLPEITGIRG